MSLFFIILMILAMVSVLGALGLGIFSMIKGNSQTSNKMMQMRVLLQGLALAMFALAYLTSQF